MTTRVEHNSSAPSLPAEDSPVVADHLVVPMHAHLNNYYGDSIWSLAPLMENRSTSKCSIRWRNCPPEFQGELRLATWTMINGALRPTFLKERSASLRGRLAPESLRNAVLAWMQLARWLPKRDIHTLAECDSQVLHEYGLHMRDSGLGRESVRQILGALTRLWAFDQLSERPAGIGRTPWDEIGVDDYLPAMASSGGENDTEVLAEQTMGPLLIWAIRMVDDFADDILTAWAEHQRLAAAGHANHSSQAGKDALHAFLMPLIAAKEPLPTVRIGDDAAFARHYVGGLTGASKSQVAAIVKREGLVELAARQPGPCPMGTPVTGHIGGSPWRDAMDFDESAGLMRHLGTACFIVIAYLTGMRPSENGAELHLMQHSAGFK
ncbi:hypothetical protein [Streptomyces sp. 6N106]|uniref:hypothetical protein n=1 Tax=Streptomyces sp. 6N106 TaxID=3457418 RepID=UPI003FCF2E38